MGRIPIHCTHSQKRPSSQDTQQNLPSSKTLSTCINMLGTIGNVFLSFKSCARYSGVGAIGFSCIISGVVGGILLAIFGGSIARIWASSG